MAISTPVRGAAATVSQTDRMIFIKNTYLHLGLAMLLFVGLEYILLARPETESLRNALTNFAFGGRYNWFAVLGAFMVAGWLGNKWARSDTSPGIQYLGLLLYVVAETFIFCPLLMIVVYYAKAPEVLGQAGLITGLLFTGLTLTVFITKKDFSFMRGILTVGAWAALGIIVAGMLFGFQLGLFFSGAMVALAGGYILYYTSAVMRDFRTDQHVAAALALFSAVALMLWYVIILLMNSRD